MVDAGNALVGQLEDVFHGGWRYYRGILLLGRQRWLDLEHLFVLAVKLDGFQRQGGLLTSRRCHRLAPLLCLEASGQGRVEGAILLECVHWFLPHLQRHAGLGVADLHGPEEALRLRFCKLLDLRTHTT